MCENTENVQFIQNYNLEYDELWEMGSTQTMDSQETKKKLIYFIPGNPGAIRCYTEFFKILAQVTSFDVCACSHKGHSGISQSLFGIQDQIIHHKQQLEVKSRSYSTVVVMAHSFGGYISMKCVELTKALGEKFVGFFFISPTFTRFPTWTYWRHLIYSYNPLRYIIEVILPRLSLVRYFMPNPNPKKLFEDLRSGKFINNIMFLLDDELVTLPEEIPFTFLQKNRIGIVYASPDPYIDDTTQSKIRSFSYHLNTNSENNRLSAISSKTIKHGFFSYPQQNSLIAHSFEKWFQSGVLLATFSTSF